LGNYEISRKFVNLSLDTERETLHISDDKQRIATIDSDSTTTTIRYQLSDHLGSASVELDQNADIISYEEYYPFGTTSYRNGRNEVDVSLKRYKYVMKELDNETGLYYYGMRYYASWIAKFISVDPLQHKYPGLTPFQYASNNPITMIDIDGLEGADFQESLNSLEIQYPETEKYVDKIEDFTKGFFGTLGDIVVGESEIITQGGIGNRIAEEDKATVFPYTHDKNMLDLAIEGLAALVIATGELIKDPINPERMGEFIAITGLMIAPVVGKGVRSGKIKSSTKTNLSKNIISDEALFIKAINEVHNPTGFRNSCSSITKNVIKSMRDGEISNAGLRLRKPTSILEYASEFKISETIKFNSSAEVYSYLLENSQNGELWVIGGKISAKEQHVFNFYRTNEGKMMFGDAQKTGSGSVIYENIDIKKSLLDIDFPKGYEIFKIPNK